MRLSRILFIIVALTAFSPVTDASTINVPADKPTIQEGIDLALSGDTVLVSSGTYTGALNTDLDFLGKNIVLLSQIGADATIIDCENVEFRRGIYLHSGEDSTAKIVGFTIIRGAHRGAGIYCVGSSPVIENCVLSYHYSYYGGAAVRCDSGAAVTLRNSTISYNYSGLREKAHSQSFGIEKIANTSIAFGQGGAVCVDSGSSALVQSCDFQFNTCDEMGGAIYVRFGQVTADSCTFRGNSVFGSSTGGGAIFIDTGASSSVFSNCSFTFNHAGEASGGAILLRNSSPQFSQCLIDSNYSWLGNGGAVSATAGSAASFANCTFSANYNESGYGGAIYCANASPLFDTCLIAGNHCGLSGSIGGGGALCVDSGSAPQLAYCTLVRNFTLDSLPGAALLSLMSLPVLSASIVALNGDGGAIIGSAQLSCTDVWGNLGGDWIDSIASQEFLSGNLSIDPLFCDTANGVFTLLDSSSCLPSFNSCVTQIGALGAGCTYPEIDSIVVDTVGDNLHVLSNTPIIQWSRKDSLGGPQSEFEIAIGVDSDWSFAELWNPAPTITADSSLVYAGAPLTDGDSGYIRLRVTALGRVSPWHTIPFRLNSAPTSPLLLSPIADSIVVDSTPTLWLTNGVDGENDTLSYGVQCASDSLFAILMLDSVVPGQSDSTGYMISSTLNENSRCYWRARSFDRFEYSPWSSTASFRVNAIDEPPSQVVALTPPDSLGRPVFDMLPLFDWLSSVDPDPGDSVTHYRLELSINPQFTFSYEVDSISGTEWEVTDSLMFSLEYWWRVRAFDVSGQSSDPSEIRAFWTWTLGDIDYSHNCNVVDLTFLVSYLFLGGTPIYPRFTGDFTGNCAINIVDLTYLVNFLFKGGEPPRIGCGPAR